VTRGRNSTTEPADLAGLVRLCHHRWTIPLVAVLGRDRGARFAALQNQLNVARPSLERVLAAADRLGLVMTNPGYGHPLRPEYLLTPFGEAIAEPCLEVYLEAEQLLPADLAWRKWSLPVLAALGSGGPRFVDVQAAIGSITPRALTLAFDDLHAAGWIERVLEGDRTPRPHYVVQRRAFALTANALSLAEAAR
jgi:DNA-binding HxlR family transcriptional regulator